MKTNIILAIAAVSIIIYYVFVIVPQRDEANSEYWSNMTAQCQEVGGVLTQDGCKVD